MQDPQAGLWPSHFCRKYEEHETNSNQSHKPACVYCRGIGQQLKNDVGSERADNIHKPVPSVEFLVSKSAL
jgi:hypothetical protein